MYSSAAIRMISGSEKASARPATPLFQVQPSGWPSISQSRIGFPSAAARLRASQRLVIQVICVHLSSTGSGLIRAWSLANCSGLIGSTARRLGTNARPRKPAAKDEEVIVAFMKSPDKRTEASRAGGDTEQETMVSYRGEKGSGHKIPPSSFSCLSPSVSEIARTNRSCHAAQQRPLADIAG